MLAFSRTIIYASFAILCHLRSVFGAACEGNILSGPSQDYSFDGKLSIIDFATSVTYVEEAAGEFGRTFL